MTFDARETSKEDGAPVGLFLFEWGDDASAFFAYTDIDISVSFQGKTFRPITIGRDRVEARGNLDKSILTVDITPNAELVSLYNEGVPSQVVRMTIWQGHVGEPESEYQIVWTGRVVSVEHTNRLARINAEPISTSMRRPGLRRHFAYGCPHALYSVACGANQAASTYTSTLLEIAGTTIKLTDGWQQDRDFTHFRGGFVTWVDTRYNVTQTRTILRVEKDGTIRLREGVAGIEIGDAISAVLGCPHTLAGCTDIHNNVVNYGGQPWIPRDNPMGTRNQFY